MARQLSIKTSHGGLRTVLLDNTRIVLGRSETCVLSYPNDTMLSRTHLAFEPGPEEWILCDLGSTNGTQLNNHRVSGRKPLKLGDKIVAGGLTILYLGTEPSADLKPPTIEITSDPILDNKTVAMTLEKVMALAADPSSGQSDLHAQARMRALIDAGRELAAHRPLDELFQVIVKLATSAVLAKRGVLMTFQGADLVVSATIGEGFRLSSSVVSRVVEKRELKIMIAVDKD